MEKIILALSLIALFRSLRAFSKIWVSQRFIKSRSTNTGAPKNNNDFYIVIPVLREQNIIAETLDYYLEVIRTNNKNIKLNIVVVGTTKEEIEKQENKKYLSDVLSMCVEGAKRDDLRQAFVGILSDNTINNILKIGEKITLSNLLDLYDAQFSSGDVVKKWIIERKDVLKHEKGISYQYLECPDTSGNRTSQINYAFSILRKDMKDDDIFVIYDADSKPEKNTFYDVASRDLECGQQPLHYLDAGNRLAHEHKNPIVVANALYQSCWTIIKEIPNFMAYMQHIEALPSSNGGYVQYKNSVYMFGHGEFLTTNFLDKIKGLPKNVITDGMQLGYRLSLINQPVQLLSTFCSDDVPNAVSSLITQHSRWFAGNIQYGSAYKWASDFLKIKLPKKSYFENILLNANWMLRPFLFLGLGILTFFMPNVTLRFVSQTALLFSLVIYSYITPYFALKLMPVKPDVRFIDWFFIPIAILVKSLGPWKYIADVISNKVFGSGILFKKVER